jgi:ATP synthase subunit alpha
MQAFAMFASDLDAASRQQLDRGARLVELLRQGQYAPYPVEEQVISVWAGVQGHFDDVPVNDVLRFEQEFLDYLRHNTEVLQTIAETKLFGDDLREATERALADFKQVFRTFDGSPLVDDHAPATDDAIAQETIVRKKRG